MCRERNRRATCVVGLNVVCAKEFDNFELLLYLLN